MDKNHVGDLQKDGETAKKSTRTRPILVVLVVVCLGLAIAVGVLAYKVANPPETEPAPSSTTAPSTTPSIPLGQSYNSYSGQYRYAAVAADYGLCSKIGTQMIARGVSTVDSAIAVLICQGATHFHSSGIGGGHFMTIYDRNTKTAAAIIAREQAPLSATETMYINSTASSTRGGTAVAIPNELRGIQLAYDEFGGSVPWKELFQPTIDMCENGFPVSSSLASSIADNWVTAQDPRYKPLKDLISDDGGNQLQEGDLMKRPALAATLREVADNGIDAFYDGSLSDDIVREVNEAGGSISRVDLRGCTAVKKEAAHCHLDNGEYAVYGPPPPSSAAVVQFIINILDGYNMSPDSVKDEASSILSNHRVVEATKFGFGKRSNLGDADFVDVDDLAYNMTSRVWADYYRGKIKDDRTMPLSYYEPDFEIVENHGTSHMSILGRDGSAVGITTTINFGFGSKVVGDRTGIVYNNEMDDFSTSGMVNGFGVSPSPANFIKPRKRPMSSMSPSVVVNKDGDVVMIAGASGGTRIISATAQTLLRRLWWTDDLKEAVDFQRLHDQLMPNDTYYERSMPQYLLDGLAGKGHTMTQRNGFIGVVQAIHTSCPGGCSNCSPCISAVSDGRKGGYPDGF